MEKRVATYGTFDCFHYGHMRLLERAKQLGAYLMVGLSTDEFNKEKGKVSVFNYSRRYHDLEGVSHVDQIYPEWDMGQKEDDIRKRNIDILVMGDDWAGEFDDLPCEVVYLPRTPRIASSRIKELL